jgi:alkyl hydroperoxide reductase subunit AhpC
MVTLNKMLSEFKAADTQVMGISCDSKYSHMAWSVRLHNLAFPLLSDFWPHGEMSSKYGVFEPDGADVRGTFAIDRDGVIRFVQVAGKNQERTLEDMRSALYSVAPEARAA